MGNLTTSTYIQGRRFAIYCDADHNANEALIDTLISPTIGINQRFRITGCLVMAINADPLNAVAAAPSGGFSINDEGLGSPAPTYPIICFSLVRAGSNPSQINTAFSGHEGDGESGLLTPDNGGIYWTSYSDTAAHMRYHGWITGWIEDRSSEAGGGHSDETLTTAVVDTDGG